MGYGIKCTSNYAQRFSYAFMHLVARFLRPFDHAEFEAETCPKRLAWIAIRREMSADKSVFEQCKLHSCELGQSSLVTRTSRQLASSVVHGYF